MNDGSTSAPVDAAGFDTREGFTDALRRGLQAAVDARSRRIVCCDPDFADWPLDDEAWTGALLPWLKLPMRRLVLLAGSYDEVPRRHPRFTAWRRDWAHAIEAWRPAEPASTALPTLLVADGGVGVRLVDRRHWRGSAGSDPRRARVWLDEVDAHLQRSESAFAVQYLGL